MPIDLSFRKYAVQSLPKEIGVYVLCDLDEVPIYVGRSSDGIRARVQRHLTSARSDIIANRQIDVWEIAFVWAFPIQDQTKLGEVESQLFHFYHPRNPLMNGSILARPKTKLDAAPIPPHKVQVMRDSEIAEKKDPALRLPRQAEHYSQIVNHFLTVKDSDEIARAMDAHFARLKRYHNQLLKSALLFADA